MLWEEDAISAWKDLSAFHGNKMDVPSVTAQELLTNAPRLLMSGDHR